MFVLYPIMLAQFHNCLQTKANCCLQYLFNVFLIELSRLSANTIQWPTITHTNVYILIAQTQRHTAKQDEQEKIDKRRVFFFLQHFVNIAPYLIVSLCCCPTKFWGITQSVFNSFNCISAHLHSEDRKQHYERALLLLQLW